MNIAQLIASALLAVAVSQVSFANQPMVEAGQDQAVKIATTNQERILCLGVLMREQDCPEDYRGVSLATLGD